MSKCIDTPSSRPGSLGYPMRMSLPICSIGGFFSSARMCSSARAKSITPYRGLRNRANIGLATLPHAISNSTETALKRAKRAGRKFDDVRYSFRPLPFAQLSFRSPLSSHVPSRNIFESDGARCPAFVP